MTNAAAIAEIALSAAADAAYACPYIDGDRGDCGNAFVVLPRQAGRKALVEALAANGARSSKHHGGGLAIHILGGLRRYQSRAIFEAGCDAFVASIRSAGVEAHTYSYAD